jgi:hypothetical protein
MSTRSIIRIIDRNGTNDLFHHYDGYPSGVGAELMYYIYPLIQRYNHYRWKDLFTILNKADDDYRIATGVHPDIEFMYIINLKTKKIQCLDGYYKETDRHEWIWHTSMERDLTRFLPLEQKRKYT